MNKLYIHCIICCCCWCCCLSSVHFLYSWWHMTLSQCVGKSLENERHGWWQWQRHSFNGNHNGTVCHNELYQTEEKISTKKWNIKYEHIWNGTNCTSTATVTVCYTFTQCQSIAEHKMIHIRIKNISSSRVIRVCLSECGFVYSFDFYSFSNFFFSLSHFERVLHVSYSECDCSHSWEIPSSLLKCNQLYLTRLL